MRRCIIIDFPQTGHTGKRESGMRMPFRSRTMLKMLYPLPMTHNGGEDKEFLSAKTLLIGMKTVCLFLISVEIDESASIDQELQWSIKRKEPCIYYHGNDEPP
jgi:hypothetical protein